jgi:uncharacterized protein
MLQPEVSDSTSTPMLNQVSLTRPQPQPQPQLCFGQVRHQRLRPANNKFAYGTYFVRLPLRSMAQAGFSCALFTRNRFNLLSFYDRDYGDGKQNLVDWITHLLADHDIHDADGEIWLQTMPRVLGFVFNPVSFWFCHRQDGSLRAIVCDVHNTFGERHCYLLTDGVSIANGKELTAGKVFHVSPFCQVGGHYRFRFLHALRSAIHHHYLARIDYHDADGPILQTSVSGKAHPVTTATVARAFFGMPIMTVGVVVRIHWQAVRLFFARVPFFSKPIPPKQKVSR